MATAQDIIVDAFLEADVLDQPGQLPGPNFLTYGLGRLNRITSQLSTRRLFIWEIREQRFTLTQPYPVVGYYTIGPTGDFVTERPLGLGPGNGIENANLVLTNNNPEASLPLYIMNKEEWANLSVKDIQTSVPTGIYNDGAFPNSRLYLWPEPNQANDLQIYTRKQVQQFSALATTFEMPPGYQEAVTTTLAERLCSAYKKGVVPQSLADAAKAARAAVVSLNSASPNISNDAANLGGSVAMGRRGDFNWTNGNLS